MSGKGEKVAEGLKWPIAAFEVMVAPATPTPVNPTVYLVVRPGWAGVDGETVWFESGNTTLGYEVAYISDPCPWPAEVERVLKGDFTGMIFPVLHPTDAYQPSTPIVRIA